MKFIKSALAATSISALAMSAQAQDSGAYVNLGVQTLEFDTYNILGRVGYNFNEYFGVEAEGSIGIFGEEEDGIEIDSPYSLGGFAVAQFPLTQKFDIFGRVGYSIVNLEVGVEDFGEVDENVDGVGFGGGIEYSFNDSNGVRLGYTYQTLSDFDDIEVGNASVFDISYVRKF